MAYRKIDASVDEEMLALRKSGMLDKDIADVVGVSVDTVRNRIGRNPLEPNRPGAKQKVSDDELITLANKGMKMTEIAKTLGISYQTVRAHFKKLRTNHMVKPLMELPAKEPEKPAEPAFDPAFDVEHTRRVAPTPSSNRPAAIKTNLFDFAYVPVITEQLYTLSKHAIPEPWKFKDAGYNKTNNPELTILEMYIRETFQRLAEAYNNSSVEDADRIIYIRKNICCFHTGLYTPDYRGIYAVLIPNTNPMNNKDWYFQRFDEQNGYLLRNIHPLPEPLRQTGTKLFDGNMPLLINTNHIIGNPKNVERLPDMVLNYWNGALLLETAVEFAKRKAAANPQTVISMLKFGALQFLLPLYITNPDVPDVVAVLVDAGTHYHLQTCLTPHMAYLTVRGSGSRPTADWLRALVE